MKEVPACGDVTLSGGETFFIGGPGVRLVTKRLFEGGPGVRRDDRPVFFRKEEIPAQGRNLIAIGSELPHDK